MSTGVFQCKKNAVATGSLERVLTATTKVPKFCAAVINCRAELINQLARLPERMVFYIARCYRDERPQAGRFDIGAERLLLAMTAQGLL